MCLPTEEAVFQNPLLHHQLVDIAVIIEQSGISQHLFVGLLLDNQQGCVNLTREKCHGN